MFYPAVHPINTAVGLYSFGRSYINEQILLSRALYDDSARLAYGNIQTRKINAIMNAFFEEYKKLSSGDSLIVAEGAGEVLGTAIGMFSGGASIEGASAVGMFSKVERAGVGLGGENLPKTRPELHAHLEKKGYVFKGMSEKGYVTYKGPDGSAVTIKPNGEVIPTKRVWNTEGTKKYPERQDYYGNRLPDQAHSTDHYVDPCVGPLKPKNLSE